MTVAATFTLLSGGIDSTTCLYYAQREFNQWENPGIEHFAIGINYGQRHKKELYCAEQIAAEAGARYENLSLSGILGSSGSKLTDANTSVPEVSYDEIEGLSPLYVPFRNGLMLAALAARAQSYLTKLDDPDVEAILLYGAHNEDAHNWAYPDCTPEFIGSMATAIYIGTNQMVRLVTPLMWSDKAGVIKLGTELSVPYQMTWSCYKGDDEHCGVCPTCQSRAEGFIKARVPDPTDYAQEPPPVVHKKERDKRIAEGEAPF